MTAYMQSICRFTLGLACLTLAVGGASAQPRDRAFQFGLIGDMPYGGGGLVARHDYGFNYMSGDFQEEIECLGIEASPSFVREPQGNGVAERFIRTSHGDVQVKGV